MTGSEPSAAGQTAAAPARRRSPVTMGWRWLLPRPTLRLRLTVLYGALFLAAGALLLLLSFLLFRRGLDNALQAPLQHGRLRLPRPFITVPPPHSPAGPAAKGLSSKLPTRAQLEVRDQAVHQLLVQSGIALAVMALASVGLGWWVAGRALRPLRRMTATARSLSEASLHERIALDGPSDEMRELAETFDAMLDRLEAAFESQRSFVANASHELRTPLSIQRALLDVALDDPHAPASELREAARQVLAVTARSEHLIENLLILARSTRGLSPGDRQATELAEIARQALDQEWPAAGPHPPALRCSLRPAPVNGDPALLTHLAANLIQNAIRHNSPGGWVELSTATTGGQVSLTVSNSGPAIPAEQVGELFRPFRRLAPDRTGSVRGSGVGLSIVHAVASAHGATVTAAPFPAGGLSVSVWFPRLPADPQPGTPAPRPLAPGRT